MQPFQEAGEKFKERSKLPFQMMGKATNLLSYYVPANIAIGGLSKLNPTFDKFFKLANKFGFSEEDALENLREKEKKFEEKKSKAKSVFEELLGDIDINQLPEPVQNQLGFLKTISDQLEKKGTHRESSTFKRLKKKIDEVLSGKIGELQGEAMAMPQQTAQQQPGQGQQALMAILQKIQASRGG